MEKSVKEWFRERLNEQGEKVKNRFIDRPVAKKRYENLMLMIGSFILAYFVFSLLCVFKVIGEWW